ncbi:MAG TPA: ComF family protein [Patescibacteria group bacterium]|nr:ComF family protein [Patescibacteria group bacterium]
MAILDLFFPKTCLGCKKSGVYICGDCVAKVPVLKSVCPYCEKASIDGLAHIKCAKKYGIDGLTSIWDYEGVIRKAILALKFKYSTEVGKELASYFVEYLRSQYTIYNILNTFTLVPIPLHWHRHNVRGFNQSEEIGKLVAKEMGWGFNTDLLIKKKSTVSQVQLSVDDRKKNLQGVFALNSRFQLPNSVILFDDVFTTGSTLKECAKVLKRAGVEKVWGITIAR